MLTVGVMIVMMKSHHLHQQAPGVTVCVLLATLGVAVRSLIDEKVSSRNPKQCIQLNMFFLSLHKHIVRYRHINMRTDSAT